MTADQIAGLVRAIIAALGGYAIGQGWADAELVATVGGAAGVVAAGIWSFMSKKRVETPEL